MADILSEKLRGILAEYNADYGEKSIDGSGDVHYVCIRPEISGSYDTSTEFEFKDEDYLIRQISICSENYDPDEEVELWLKSDRHPSVRQMLKEFDELADQYDELSMKVTVYALEKAEEKAWEKR